MRASEDACFSGVGMTGCLCACTVVFRVLLGSRVALRYDLGNRLCNLEVYPHIDESTDAVSLDL